ncbi:MAG: nitroreductase family protein [Sarcina sp.]
MMKEEHIIEVNKDLCIGCSLCKNDCPVNNISIIDNKSIIKTQECLKCGHCVAICPKKAITMTGFDEEPIEIDKQPVVDSDNLLMALKAKRSIRKFRDKEVSNEIIEKIIQAGRFTPSAKNDQDVSYIVLAKDKSKFEDVAVKLFRRIKPIVSIWMKDAREVVIDDNFFFKKAPVVILVVSKNKVNASLAASNMSLMAESFGLGVLYSGFFSEVIKFSSKLKKLLNLKAKNEVVATLVIGYPAVKYRRTTQKNRAKVEYL